MASGKIVAQKGWFLWHASSWTDVESEEVSGHFGFRYVTADDEYVRCYKANAIALSSERAIARIKRKLCKAVEHDAYYIQRRAAKEAAKVKVDFDPVLDCKDD